MKTITVREIINRSDSIRLDDRLFDTSNDIDVSELLNLDIPREATITNNLNEAFVSKDFGQNWILLATQSNK